MKLQFINNISLDVISGGHIYNAAIIEGFKQKGIEIDYNFSPLNKAYDMSIIDSLSMAETDPDYFNTNKPIIALIHQLPKLQNDCLHFFRTHAKFIVTGAPTKHKLIKLWQINDHDVNIIRPGVSQSWKPKTVFNAEPKRIIIVSNFIRNKGFEMLIQIINQLKHLKLRFDIIGNNQLDKDYAKDIVRWIQNTNANVTFHFNLNRQDVYNRLIESDVFLSLSKSESFGMAIFEALTIGLPCLTYKTGDYNYFENHPNYVGLDSYSERSFSEIIEEWVSHPALYRTFCNTNAQNKRDWKHVVDDFFIYLQNTVSC